MPKVWSIFCHLAIATILFQTSSTKSFGETCADHSDCKNSGEANNLICVKADVNTEFRSCQCEQNFDWIGLKCVPANAAGNLTELLAILSPLFVAGIFTSCFLIVCCFCVSKNTTALNQPDASNKYDIETGGPTMLEEISEEVANEAFLNRDDDVAKIRHNGVKGKRREVNRPNGDTTELNELKGVTSTSRSKKITTKLSVEKETSNTPKISIDHAAVDDTNGTGSNRGRQAAQPDQGYQASLKLLFERPAASSEPNSRPILAMFGEYPTMHRSGSALNFGRQSSLSLLVPKDSSRPSSATSQTGRRSPVIAGPYLTDPSGLKFLQMRSYQLSPKNSFVFQNHFLEEEETSFTIEPPKMKNEAKKVEKEKKKVEKEKKKKEVGKPDQKGAAASGKIRSDSVGSGIEEIRLVQAAVYAFKRKKR